jgi:2-phosphosulfolactate phosphatase
MQVHHARLDDCAAARGAVVVIDVIRAFTTAAYAFAAGAREIVLVASVEDAFALRERRPGLRVMGEVGGFPPPGFDYGNSPSAFLDADLHGVGLIHRTTAGTQGVVRSTGAQWLYVASFVNASATVRALRRVAPPSVTLVSTGPEGEDEACAKHLEALLAGRTPSPDWVASVAGFGEQRFEDPAFAALAATKGARQFRADIPCCMALDRFGFAMRVSRSDGLLVAHPEPT